MAPGLSRMKKRTENPERGFGKRLEVTFSGKKCPVCNGTRRMKISNDINGEQYILQEETKNALRKLIEPEKKPFNGFTIGGALADEYKRFDYYTRERLAATQSDTFRRTPGL